MIELQAQLFKDLQTGEIHAVRRSLQQAIELEHSTIPLYLYAYYSLDSSKNGAIANIIWSIVMEEMLHMTLACNILNALDGHPKIDSPKFIPPYPGALPGGVESQLTVHLAPFSFHQLKAFLTIEEPEAPLVFHVAARAASKYTIGEFYREIEKQIRRLGNGAFTGDPKKQIDSSYIPGAIVVTDVDSAATAIETIVEQGEGTKKSPLEAKGSQDFAHYYRFEEIQRGKTLVKNPAATPSSPPDQQYIWGDPPIPFDKSGVYPVPTDPKSATYPTGSAAQKACQNFNYQYTTLLQTLHTGFNGTPGQISIALNQMGTIDGLATGLMSGTSLPGQYVGPSFEYQPNPPA